MEAGAVAALEKPRGMGHPDSETSVKELVQTVKLMAGVKVVRRWSRLRGTQADKSTSDKKPVTTASDTPIKIVTIGASTGGPLVLQTIFSGLSEGLPVPIVIVQHIAPGFLTGLGEWLSRTTNIPVHIAEQNELLKPGNAYLAPDGFQMGVTRGMRIKLEENSSDYNLCPSVSYLFKSISNSFQKNSIDILLTGMGRDGAAELKILRNQGAITIAQDKESSVVHGMPGEAIKLGGAVHILSADKIAGELIKITKKLKAVKK